MARDLFTETQTAAARELAAQLYREWQTSQDKGTTAFFLTSAVVSMMPNKVNAEKLIESIAAQAKITLGDIPGWPESMHGRQY